MFRAGSAAFLGDGQRNKELRGHVMVAMCERTVRAMQYLSGLIASASKFGSAGMGLTRDDTKAIAGPTR